VYTANPTYWYIAPGAFTQVSHIRMPVDAGEFFDVRGFVTNVTGVGDPDCVMEVVGSTATLLSDSGLTAAYDINTNGVDLTATYRATANGNVDVVTKCTSSVEPYIRSTLLATVLPPAQPQP
jgi:hypothetical protein